MIVDWKSHGIVIKFSIQWLDRIDKVKKIGLIKVQWKYWNKMWKRLELIRLNKKNRILKNVLVWIIVELKIFYLVKSVIND